jgi:glycosyltransferase involved in cell wall biosynthesis
MYLGDSKLAEVAMTHEYQLGSEQALEASLWADLVVMHRPSSEEWFKFIKLMQKYGKVFVADYDDNPFKTSPLNPGYQYFGTSPVEYVWPDGKKEWLWHEDMISGTGKKIFNIERNISFLETFRANFKKADMVTCTTEELANEFRSINPNTVVLPNVVTPEWYPAIPSWDKKEIRIGWQGGASHYEDLFFIQPVIVDVLKKLDNVKFVYFGDMRFKKIFDGCDQSKIEWHHWVSHDVYPYKLSLLNCDIGLCPLVDNEFNRSKSAIKWMEYSMVGMATIASNIPPYSTVIEHDKTGLLCAEDTKEWYDAIELLVKSKSKTYAMAGSAKEQVMLHHNIQKKAHLWYEAYQKLLKVK